MSFNVWGGGDKTQTSNDATALPSMTVEDRGVKINALLNGENIDVAGFQEISSRFQWDAWMKNSLDQNYSCIAATTADIESGVYIVYKKDKFDVLDSGAFCLVDGAPAVKEGTVQKYDDSDFERICNWAIFKTKETGEIFLFMDTHLAAGVAKESVADVSDVRCSQLNILISKIPIIRDKVKTEYGVSDCPVVLVGDMNSTPTSNEYKIIAQTFNDSLKVSNGTTVDGAYSTFTDFWHCETEANYKKTSARIDYIFASNENISVLNYKMVHTSTNLCSYGAYISDHNAVIAELELY